MTNFDVFADFELEIFVVCVFPVFELNDTHLFETMTQPFVVAVEQSKLLTVRNNLGEQQLLEALTLIKNRKGPLLIHCWHGSDRTGATVAAYRLVFQNWSKEQAIDEMVNGGYGYHAGIYPNLLELINKLDVAKIRKQLQVGF